MNNFIQTLYIDNRKNIFHDSFGWIFPEYHLMGWALSCLQLHKIYRKVILYANSPAASVLIDMLKLPYAQVHLTHDIFTLVHPNLWALPKIYTYSLQEHPFLHIDGDVFIFNQFDFNLLNSKLIAQNIEIATEDYYSVTQKELMRYFTFFPPCVKKDFESGIPIQTCNAGIIGGNNISFFSEYSAIAFDYVNNNIKKLQNININMFNIFFEQHLFYALAKEKGIPVNVLIKDVVNDNGYKDLGDFHDVPFNRSYLHLLGHFKRDEYTCIQMVAKLKELYPDYYERIVALFHKKKLHLSPCGFINEANSPQRLIEEKKNIHLYRLRLASSQCPPKIDKDLFQKDFDTFYQQILYLLTHKHIVYDLLERDLSAQHWYRDLFADPSVLSSKVIVRCLETEIIESEFDWAGLFNKSYRDGTRYYEDLQITNGQFFNLIVLEATDNGFSLYDINKIDHELILLLSKQLSINETLNKMKIYFEEEMLQNYYEEFENLILTSIKQLVIKKAIRPL